METINNTVNKKNLFSEIISSYYTKIQEGYKDTIDVYLGSITKEYNKKYSESYPKGIKEDEKEELLIFSNQNKTKAVFFDAVLQIDVENIKTEEIANLELKDFENELIDILDTYCFLENQRSVGRILINPMNVFGSLIYQKFAEERMNKSLLEGHRYSSYEILYHYFYESRGYRKIIEKVLVENVDKLLKEKGVDTTDTEVSVKQSSENQYLYTIRRKDKEEELNIQCVFKDGYYQYFNVNDDRYYDKFEIDFIAPDYYDYFMS